MGKVLLVEDDPDLLSRLRQWLLHEHHSVETADNAPDAISFLKTYTFDLVILDWVLRQSSGIEVVANFREMGGKTPILMLTSKGNVADKEIGLDAGADDYLSKPFHPKELSARVRALLRRQPAYSIDLLKAGKVTMDRRTHTVMCGETEVKLLPLEFSVLEFFMRHPNQVFSKEALLDRVWPSQSDASLEAVRTCLKTLRKKINLDSETAVIENIHGVGYKLVL